jgi:hypothetical protein
MNGRPEIRAPFQVEQRLDRRAALEQLDRHRGQHAGEQEGQHDAHQRQALGQQRRPVRRRHGVGDVGDPDLALLEDQLTRVEGHDDDQHEGEAAVHQFDHQVGHRIDVGAEHLAHLRCGCRSGSARRTAA